MGLASWLLTALAVFALARLVPPRASRRRSARWELVAALVTAALAGATASALDFGGFDELEWRALVFVALLAAASIGLVRAFSVARTERA